MLARRIALAIGLAAALIGSQGPEFAQQYRQRAGGALDELKRIVIAFDAEAASEGLTPSEGVRRLEGNSDPLVQKRGEDMERTIARAERLEGQLTAMADAGPLKRLAVMIAHLDPEIAERTLDAYEPAAPLTTEALATAGALGALGWAATHVVARPFRRRARPKAPQATSA